MTLREKLRNNPHIADVNLSAAILYYSYLHAPKGFKMDNFAKAEIKRLSELPDDEFQTLVNNAIAIQKQL